jgi:hypothetical protein
VLVNWDALRVISVPLESIKTTVGVNPLVTGLVVTVNLLASLNWRTHLSYR